MLDEIKDVHCYGRIGEGVDVVRFYNGQLDMVVTASHKCIASRRTRSGNGQENWYPYDFIEAKDLHTGHHLLRVAKIDENIRRSKDKEYSNDFIKLCAWVMAEGHYRENGQIFVVQSILANEEYCRQLVELSKSFNKDMVYFTGQHKNSCINMVIRWEIAKLIRDVMPCKYPSAKFISEMTASQKRLFLYEALKGDGDNVGVLPPVETITRERDFWNTDKTPRLACGKKEEADSVQHIATLLGIRTWVKPPSNRGNYYQVSFTRMGERTSLDKVDKELTKSDFVWCPETNTHTWVARRNGHIFVTGNSHPGDAVSHGIARLLLRPRMLDRLSRIKQITKAKWGITGVSDIYKDKPRKVYIK